ncbi:MAG TPA: branched-chain amino acid ABC transporter ATP-binding protein/permease [Stellaceae bacterium]|nr:branched-chain amino acid ABC transporter ATP-binding protein/permease [Stellaceae bacterium]
MKASTAQLALSLAALAVAAALVFIGNGYQVYLIAMVALTTMVGIGLNVLLGLAGQVSLGHVGFFGLGAYAVAILTMRLGMNFWPALMLAGALAGIVGMALALPALRVAGPYLAMVTIAFGFIVQNGAIEWRSLTGGANGITGVPAPVLASHVFSTRDIALLAIALAALLLFLFDRFATGSWGRALRAAQASEIASRSLGLDLVGLRVTAFALSAAAAGIAGGVFAPLSGFIGPSAFSFFQSILFLLVVIVGGAGTTAGPLVGAILVVLLPQLGARFAEYQLLAFGAMLLVVLWLAPDGVVGALTRRRRRDYGSGRALPTGRWSPDESGGRMLAARDLAISFGGIDAAGGISFTAKPGAITSIIGPNGAGKSTVLNLLSGFYRPDRGAVLLGDHRIAGSTAHAIARAGIARSFQTSQLFSGLSVAENVRVGLRGHRLGSLFPLESGGREAGERRAAAELLAFVGYAGDPDRRADDLPHVDKRLVEIARALARKPRVLLLDEPAAGLGEADTARLATLLRRIAAMQIAVVLVEHDMGLVMEVSDHVVVLDAGRCIAADSPSAVQRDPAVIKAYLGEHGYEPRPRAVPLPPAREPALAIAALRAGYGEVEVLHAIDLTVAPGEFIAVLGANGAGKSTLMRAASGLLRPVKGAIRLGGADVSALPAQRTVRQGLVLVPEGRQVFPELSVSDNLRLGGYARRSADLDSEIERLFARFPQLRERRDQRAGLLSGGEQQMLALARGLIAAPRVLLLDEPSLGLAPAVIARLFTALAELRDEGVTLVLVDQMAGMALALADRGYVLEGGRVRRSGTAASLASDDTLRQAYLGGGAAP